MKAIYLNLDPYLAATKAWNDANPLDPDTGERPAPPPTFNPLPLAVTLPLGEDVAIMLERKFEGVVEGVDDFSADEIEGGLKVFVGLQSETIPSIAHDIVPGLSSFDPSAKYSVMTISGDVTVIATIRCGDDDADVVIPLTVLVRREQASGPVDLVDFTPPASAIAAGTDLKGATFDGNEIVAAAGTGALSAPAGA